MADKCGSGIQVISRAVTILKEVSASHEGLSLGQIAGATGLARSTVQRIVDALEMEHLVQAGAKGVRPGWGLRRLAEMPVPGLAHELRPYLYRLFDETRETVDLSTLDGTTVLFMDRFLSDQDVRAVPDIRVKYPAYAMANGKALLSTLDNKTIYEFYGHEKLKRITPVSLSNVTDLLTQLDTIRAGRFAYDVEEHAMDSCAIGLPLNTKDELKLAISVVIPTERFHEKKKNIEKALRKCVDNCNSRLITLQPPLQAFNK